MAVARLADQMLGTRITRNGRAPREKSTMPGWNSRDYFGREIRRGTYLAGDLANTQEAEEESGGYRGSGGYAADMPGLNETLPVNIRNLCDAAHMEDIAQVLHPEAQFSKAYLRLERCEAVGTEGPKIIWDVSIGLANYVRGAVATKILLENMHSIRVGTMIYPVFPDITYRFGAALLFDEWRTQAYQDDRGPTYQVRGYMSQYNDFAYRGITRWFPSTRNNIQEHNEYLDRHGYSGTWMATKPIERIDRISMQMFTSVVTPLASIPLAQLYAQITATTIGAGGMTVTVEMGPDYLYIRDSFVAVVSGFRTDSPADDAKCAVINRLEGWEAMDDMTGVLTLKDFTVSMNLQPYTRVALGSMVFVGTPVLTDAQVMFMPFNTACDLELTVRLEKPRVFSF